MVQKNCIPARSPIPFPPIEFFETCIIVNKEILYIVRTVWSLSI